MQGRSAGAAAARRRCAAAASGAETSVPPRTQAANWRPSPLCWAQALMLRLHASALAPGAPLRLSRRWGVCARRPATQAAAGASGSSSESGAGTGGGGGEPPQAAAVQIDYRGRRLQAAPGTTLRTALLEAGVSPHNGRAVLINCRGLGTCGTCAVAVQGAVEPAEWTPQERLRLNFPPHSAPNNQRLRLACQVGGCRPVAAAGRGVPRCRPPPRLLPAAVPELPSPLLPCLPNCACRWPAPAASCA